MPSFMSTWSSLMGSRRGSPIHATGWLRGIRVPFALYPLPLLYPCRLLRAALHTVPPFARIPGLHRLPGSFRKPALNFLSAQARLEVRIIEEELFDGLVL